MTTDLKVQSYYHVAFSSPWTDLDCDVKITGMTSISTLSELDPSYDIKAKYFNAYNLGISKYLLLITNSTVIYACRKIKSYDPIKIGEKSTDTIYIPASLIDFTKTYQFQEAKKYNFLVNTGMKKFDSVLDENDFFEAATNNLIKAINDIDDFVADNLNIQVSSTDVLTTNSALADIKARQTELINRRDLALKQNKDNQEAAERNLYSKTKEAESASSEYREYKDRLITQMNDVGRLQAETELENNRLLRVKQVMQEICTKIRNGEYSASSFPSFDELYSDASNALDNEKKS